MDAAATPKQIIAAATRGCTPIGGAFALPRSLHARGSLALLPARLDTDDVRGMVTKVFAVAANEYYHVAVPDMLATPPGSTTTTLVVHHTAVLLLAAPPPEAAPALPPVVEAASPPAPAPEDEQSPRLTSRTVLSTWFASSARLWVADGAKSAHHQNPS